MKIKLAIIGMGLAIILLAGLIVYIITAFIAVIKGLAELVN